MANYAYSTLEVAVTANTRELPGQVKAAATKAGDEAGATISGRLGKGLAKIAPIAGTVGRSVATGLGVATTAAVAFGVEAFKAASKVAAMDASLRALAKANGVSYAAMQKQVAGLKALGLQTGQAQQTVADLTREHIGLAHATSLARIAQNASVVTGRDYSSVETAITKAIATGNASALKRAGIYVDSKTALDKYAASIGKTSTELTNAEKSQAVLNAVTKAGGSIAGAYAAQLKTPQGALRLLKLTAEDLTETIGGQLVKVLTPAFVGFAKLGQSIAEAVGPGGKLAPIVNAIGVAAGRVLGPVGGLGARLTRFIDKINPQTIAKIADAIKRFGPALLGVGAASAVFTGAGLLGHIPILGGLLEHLLGPLMLVKNGILSIAKAAAVQLVPALGGVVGEAEGLGKALGAAAGPVGIILTIFATLMAVSPQFRQAVMGLVRALITALMPAFKAILAALKPLLPIITLLGRTLGQLLAPIIKALTPLLLSLTPLVALLAQLLGLVLGVVLKLLVPAINLYVAFQKWYVIKVLVPLIRLLVGALTWLVRIITDVVRWILGGSPGLIPALLDLQRVAVSVTRVMVSVVVAGFTVIRNAIVSAWRAVTKVSIEAWGAIRSVVVTTMRALVTVVGTVMGLLRAAVSRGLNALVGIVRTIAGNLYAAGRSAIGNLLRGMTSALAGIAGWVKGHIVDPVVNAVKHFFGIHSPSEVMAGLGHNVAAGFIQGIVRANPLAVAKTVFGGIPNALASLVTKGMVSLGSLPAKALSALGKVGGFFKGALTKIGGFFGGLFGGGTGTGVMRWAGIMRAVLAHFGIPQLFGTFMTQMQTESGGNQFAINRWDSNAAAGIPSQGLMQVIPPTFAAYAGPYRSRGILDPLANIYAAVAYAIARYGSSIAAVLGHGHGYATGGMITEPITGFGHRTGSAYFFGERGPEYVSPLTGPAAQMPAAQQAVVIHVHPAQGQSEVQIAAAVSRRLAWAAATGRA